MRTRWSVAVVAVAVLAVAVAGGTDARTIPVKWTDRQPLVGGHVVYRTTKVWFRGERFAVELTITNRTPHDVMFFPVTTPDDPTFISKPGFGLAWREPPSPNIHTRRLRRVVPRSYSQKFPFRLHASRTVKLTFSGRSPLLRTHRTWWVTFGRASSWEGKRILSPDSYWISDKTFAT